MIRASRVLSLARNRRTLERFADRGVPEESLASVLECARYACSAKEAQPWRFVVIQDAVARHAIAAASFHHPHVQTAPVLVVCCARIHSHISGTGRPSYPIDLAAATQIMSLAAADVGLAASWITGFREPEVRESLGIPRDVPVVSVLAIGYPQGIGPLPERAPREEVISWGRWREAQGRSP